MKPSEALEIAIERGGFITTSYGRGKPGEVILKCPNNIREALKELNSHNMGCDRFLVLLAGEESVYTKHIRELMLEFDKLIGVGS
jgi:hypothetical protein